MSGRTHEPGAALVLERTVILAAAALLALGCRPGTAGDGTTDPPVPPGDGSGDLAVPGEPDAAFGVTWHLARTDSVSGLALSFSNPRADGIGPVGLDVHGDSMRFPLPFDRSAACDLTRREDGSWRGSCGEVPHGRLDRYLHRRGDGLSLSTLTEEFWEHSDVVTMPQATTLTGYLMDAHDMEAVRALWDRGIGEAEAVLGYGIDELARRWRAWAEARYEPASEAEFDATIGSDEGCPRVKP